MVKMAMRWLLCNKNMVKLMKMVVGQEGDGEDGEDGCCARGIW